MKKNKNLITNDSKEMMRRKTEQIKGVQFNCDKEF